MAECEHCGAELAADSETCPRCGQARTPDELLGTEILGRYTLVKLIAEGGMGRVYLAEQAVGTVQRRVAVKVLRKQLGQDKQLMSRFAREAETLVRLTHPNTVQLFDFGALPDGTLALAMEYVKGHSLAFELHKGPLSVQRAERMLTQICGALEEAHESGIVHRDLKPDNLLIADRVGQGDFVKVLDFGIAKVADDAIGSERKNTKLTQQGMIIGTPPYMSPEQFSGEATDARSDIYSLGVIAYEMLAGKLPFVANTPWEWASKHLTAAPDSLHPDTQRGLSFAHARAIDAALQKNPADRPQTVQAFLDMFTTREGAGAVTMPLARTELAPKVSTPPPVHDSDEHPSTNTTRTGSLLQKRSFGLAGLVLAAVAAAAVGVVLYFALRRAPGQSALAPAALPSTAASMAAAPSAPAALPLGVAPPEATPTPEEPRHRHREHPRGAARSESEPVRSADLARTAPEPIRSEPTRGGPEPVRGEARSEGPQPIVKASQSSPDLDARIAQIVANTSARPEVALGLYQAATGRYGAHPSLSSLRPQLRGAVEGRVRQLLAGGRCAQAQAIQRALRGALGGAAPAGLFGPSCPAP
ncbi:MAG TPA: protein kinase [Polyangiales bacterium]|nr:protein kinase [Polyangiales bacterium]